MGRGQRHAEEALVVAVQVLDEAGHRRRTATGIAPCAAATWMYAGTSAFESVLVEGPWPRGDLPGGQEPVACGEARIPGRGPNDGRPSEGLIFVTPRCTPARQSGPRRLRRPWRPLCSGLARSSFSWPAAFGSRRLPIESITPTSNLPWSFPRAAPNASSTDGSGIGSSPKRA